MADVGSPSGQLPGRWSAAAERSDLWVDAGVDPRLGESPVGERAMLAEYLRAGRLTLEMKCADLDASQMAARSVPPSTMSLLGLVRHLADVERYWFRQVIAGEDAPRRFRAGGDPEGEWTGAVGDPAVVAEAWAAWREETAFAQRVVDRSADLEMTGLHRGEPISLREVLVHMIEEYGRHCGHADLLRERIDGRVGQ